MVSKAQFLFVEEHRALVKQLCVELEYIEEDWQEALGEVRVDVEMDPLELFKESRTGFGRSRFQLLFQDAESTERDKLRLLFFSHSKQNPTVQSGKQMLEVLSAVIERLMMDERHGAAMVVSDVEGAVRHLYRRRLQPPYPDVLSDDIVWGSLHHAWNDERYWFSFEELQLFCAYLGPEDVVVYSHRISAGEEDR